MDERQLRSLKAYHNTVTILKARPALSREVRAIVDSLAATIKEIRRVESSRIAEGTRAYLTAVRHPLEKMRHEEMLPLSRMARRIFKGESGILAAVRVPHKHANTEVIIDAALLMVSTLEPHRAQLRASRIDPGRLGRLKKEALRLNKLQTAAMSKVADKGAPALRLRELFSSAYDEVFALHSLADVTLTPSERIMYKSISRVGKRMGRPRKRRPPGSA